MASARIDEYAVIGDCRSAALISKSGSMDWLCWPRFDSPSLFGALLSDGAGKWSLSPRGKFEIRRRYLEGTNVLATTFTGESGILTVTDLMPIASEEDKRKSLCPDHEVLRLARCERGEVELETAFEPGPGYGKERVRIKKSPFGLRVETTQGLIMLHSQLDLKTDGRTAHGRRTLRAGESVALSLTFADDTPAIIPPLGQRAFSVIDRSTTWWRQWSARMTYDGPKRDMVERSALALKLLVYAPSGAIVAAPTTSLPEKIGGGLNWDYRYCWLRDASLTVRALLGLGYYDEAQAFVYWLIQSTRLSRPRLNILYDVFGNQPGKERVLEHLQGYRNSRPVRIGNAAKDQRQLDVYGEVIDAAAHLALAGITLDKESRALLCGFGRYICENWEQPDEGIWEPRSGPRENTHSRVLCWTGLSELINLQQKGYVNAKEASRFQHCRDRIRRQVESRSWNQDLESYTAKLDGDEVDASLLLMAWYGFEDASSFKMKSTFHRICRELSAGGHLLYRYRGGGAPGEGAFGACGFWAAEHLALGAGSPEHAKTSFEQLLTYSNDVGLFAEEVDPSSGQALGNFPQAFSHIALINAALSLNNRLKGKTSFRKEAARR